MLRAPLTLGARPTHIHAMQLAQIWRYPVKSMAGEQLQATRVYHDGIPGDRIVHVRRGERLITSRSRPQLLRFHATLAGEPLVDGLPWRDPQILSRVRAAVDMPDAELVRDESTDRFDVLPLLVATDGALAAFGHDSRRLRPNLVIAGVEGLAERDWPGRVLAIGDVRIRLASRRRRCIMTTFHPDTAEQDPQVLLDIHRRFGGELALDAGVLAPGAIALGDPVRLL